MIIQIHLKILCSHMGKLGYVLEDFSLGLFFGRKHKEFYFDDRSLLNAIDKDIILHDWLIQNGLPEIVEDDALTDIERRILPERPPCAPPITHYDLSQLDRQAHDYLMHYRQTAKFDSHWRLRDFWGNPLWHQPEIDSWVDTDWWRTQAASDHDELLLSLFGDAEAKRHLLHSMRAISSKGWSAGFTIYENVCPLSVFLAREYAWPEDPVLDFYANDEGKIPADYWLCFFPDVPQEFKLHAAAKLKCYLAPEAPHPDFPDSSDDCPFRSINALLRVFHKGEIETFVDAELIALLRGFCQGRAAMPWKSFWEDIEIIEIARFFDWSEIVDILNANPSFWDLWPRGPSSQCLLSISLFENFQVTQRMAAYLINQDDDQILRDELQCREQFPLYAERLRSLNDLRREDAILQYRRCESGNERLAAAIAWQRTRRSL